MRRSPLRLRLTTSEHLRLEVDGIAYGLAPYGGLIRFWNSLLPRLSEFGIDVDLRLPTHIRAELPSVSALPPGQADAFTSTYFTTTVRAPSIVVVHDLIYELQPTTQQNPDWHRTLAAKKDAIASASFIAVPSESTAEGVRRVYSPTVSVEVIPHGVSHIFRPEQADIDDQRLSALLDRHLVSKPFILHVGGRSTYKRFEDILRAFASSRQLQNDYQLLVVGSETHPRPEESPLLEQLPPGTANFLGYQEDADLAAIYRKSAVVVSASEAEGFGLVVAEAISCGAPVACTAIPAHLEHGGRYASTFEPGDVAGLAQAIHSASGADRSTLLSAAADIRRQHDWTRVARSFALAVRSVARP